MSSADKRSASQRLQVSVRRARPREAGQLTALSIRSKQSNGYDDAFMTACREELTVTEQQINDSEYWVVETGDALCACACLIMNASMRSGEIHTFFIDPPYQRQGIGRLLFTKLRERAQAGQLTMLHLDADPSAVPFYQSMGFRVSGHSASGSIPGRMLPRMTLPLGAGA